MKLHNATQTLYGKARAGNSCHVFTETTMSDKIDWKKEPMRMLEKVMGDNYTTVSNREPMLSILKRRYPQKFAVGDTVRMNRMSDGEVITGKVTDVQWARGMWFYTLDGKLVGHSGPFPEGSMQNQPQCCSEFSPCPHGRCKECQTCIECEDDAERYHRATHAPEKPNG
jgi:hypothetical protein